MDGHGRDRFLGGHGEARFRGLARTLGMERLVRLVLPIQQPELGLWTQASSHCSVLPPFSEGFGRVVLDAMPCGRPVVGMRVGRFPSPSSMG